MEETFPQLRTATSLDLKGTVNLLIEESVKLTGSTMAYFAILDEPGTTLTMLAWSNSAMAQCRMMELPMVYPVEATGLWGDCIRERQAVITNDYPACTRATKKGYPDGHVPVLRHMNVPVMEGANMRGILGVGNKTDEYTQQDAEALQAFANAAWPYVRQAQRRAAP